MQTCCGQIGGCCRCIASTDARRWPSPRLRGNPVQRLKEHKPMIWGAAYSLFGPLPCLAGSRVLPAVNGSSGAPEWGPEGRLPLLVDRSSSDTKGLCGEVGSGFADSGRPSWNGSAKPCPSSREPARRDRFSPGCAPIQKLESMGLYKLRGEFRSSGQRVSCDPCVRSTVPRAFEVQIVDACEVQIASTFCPQPFHRRTGRM